MTDINLKIDNKKLCVPKGTNIFMAAKNNGIYIPGLCYHPKLSQYGGCRLCMVEVTERGRSRHRFSCAQPVSEGMEVKTSTPEIKKYTKSVMEFLLVHHPLDCPTCDKSGECGLQDITHDLKLGASRFTSVRNSDPMRRDNPLLELNTNRCILCGRCVKICKEVEGLGAIDYQNRGIKTVIGTAFNKPLDCSFCGGCVSVCPTGSWQDRTLKFRARPWEMKKTPTVCTYCAVGCTVVANTKNEKVLRITSDDDLGINNGNLCIKGRFGHEFINSARRIKTPLIKKIGILCPVSWDEALDHIAKRLQDIKSEHGGNAIGGLGSEKCTNEDNYLFQKFFRSVLGTNNIDNLANMKSPMLNEFAYNSALSKYTPKSLKEIENADTLFFFGADVTEAHPVIGNMSRKAIKSNKADVIIANVRNVLFNSVADNDVRLNYKIGTQTALINALTKIIVEEKLIDLKEVDKSTENLKDLRSLLNKLDLKKLSSLAKVSEEDIRKASVLLAKPGNCFIVCGKDIEEDPSGNDAIKSLMNLCMLLNAAYHTKPESGKAYLLFSRASNNSQGVNDMGVVPGYLPGYQDINNTTHRKTIEDSWGVKLSDDVSGNDAKDIFDLASNGKLKALYVMGENPIVNYPNGKKVKDAFQKADFVVVQDSFLTETAQLADVVLPSATYAEKEGTFTNMGLEVQRLNKAIQPVGDAKADCDIICALAKKMGQTYSYKSAKAVLDEIKRVAPIYSGVSYDDLEKKSFNWGASFKEQKGPKFDIFESKPSAVKKKKDYPFVLLTGPSLNHQGTLSRNSKSLIDVSPECLVEINRKDAQELNVKDGETLTVESRQDKISLKVKTTNRVPAGTVFVSEDYEWVPVNSLRDNGYIHVTITKS